MFATLFGWLITAFRSILSNVNQSHTFFKQFFPFSVEVILTLRLVLKQLEFIFTHVFKNVVHGLKPGLGSFFYDFNRNFIDEGLGLCVELKQGPLRCGFICRFFEWFLFGILSGRRLAIVRNVLDELLSFLFFLGIKLVEIGRESKPADWRLARVRILGHYWLLIREKTINELVYLFIVNIVKLNQSIVISFIFKKESKTTTAWKITNN